jgi:hypothetical protein
VHAQSLVEHVPRGDDFQRLDGGPAEIRLAVVDVDRLGLDPCGRAVRGRLGGLFRFVIYVTITL